jgi:ABC-2 type transport system ATP-binding protein
MFIDSGKIVLETSMDALAETWRTVTVAPEKYDMAEALRPLYVSNLLGARTMLFENVAAEQLEDLGDMRAPSISELFHAKMHKQGAV